MLYEYLKSLGYSDEEINKIRNAYVFRKYSEISLYNKISDTFNYLLLFGYSAEDIIKMSVCFISLYGYGIDTIKGRLDDMLELGYTKEEIMRMTRKMPSLFGRRIDDIRIKKKFYDQLNIGDIIVKDPIHLSQSLELTFARYAFYHRMGIKIDRGNANLLFMKQELFVNKFGKTNEQLMKLYDYNEYLEKRRKKIRKD